MDKKRLEELCNRAIDGCLSPEDEQELATHLKENPGLMGELEDLGRIRSELQTHLPAEVEPPYPDFFNAHLERLIREDEMVDAPAASPVKQARSVWLGWLLPAAGAAILAFFAGTQLRGPEKPMAGAVATALPVVYSPITSVRPEAILDEDTGGTVIILEGLAAIPDNVDLAKAPWDDEGGARLASATSNTL